MIPLRTLCGAVINRLLRCRCAGYGKGEKTSSTKPKKMDEKAMEGLNVAQVACVHSHTLLVVTGQNEEQLNKLAKFKPKPPKVSCSPSPMQTSLPSL